MDMRGGTTAERVAEVQSELGVVLPEEYVAFLIETYGGAGPVGEDGWANFHSVNELVKQNAWYHEDPFEQFEGLALFGSDGGGEAGSSPRRSSRRRLRQSRSEVSVRHVSADERARDAGEQATFEEQIAMLSTERRCTAVEMVTRALVAACPASTVRPMGSLATGTADSYSDIDLAWVVPDDVFDSCIARAPDALAHAAPIRRVRIDPDFQRSRKRRLLFVRYVHLPLFWRIDLDIRAQSIAADDDYDVDNPQAHGTNWSRPASALENAVAAIKALRRDQPDVARGLLMRGYARVGHSYRPRAWSTDIVQLAELCLAAERDLQPLHQEVVALASSVEAR